MRYLAGLVLQDGDATLAVRLYERALAVRRKAFGDRHPDVAESWRDLAAGRLATNDLTGALAALEEVRAIWQKSPPSHPEDLADLEAAIARARTAVR